MNHATMLSRRALNRALTAMVLGCGIAREARGASASSFAAILAHLGFAHDEVGFILADAETGKVLEQQSPDRLFMPASVTKLPMAYAAVKILGSEYRGATTLFRPGDDICLQCGGDPV